MLPGKEWLETNMLNAFLRCFTEQRGANIFFQWKIIRNILTQNLLLIFFSKDPSLTSLPPFHPPCSLSPAWTFLPSTTRAFFTPGVVPPTACASASTNSSELYRRRRPESVYYDVSYRAPRHSEARRRAVYFELRLQSTALAADALLPLSSRRRCHEASRRQQNILKVNIKRRSVIKSGVVWCV